MNTDSRVGIVHVDLAAKVTRPEADNARLRAMLTTARTYAQDARKYVGPSVFHDALSAVVKHADEALAPPAGDEALREFGLRVARLAYDAGLDRPIPHADFDAIVAKALSGGQ